MTPTLSIRDKNEQECSSIAMEIDSLLVQTGDKESSTNDDSAKDSSDAPGEEAGVCLSEEHQRCVDAAIEYDVVEEEEEDEILGDVEGSNYSESECDLDDDEFGDNDEDVYNADDYEMDDIESAPEYYDVDHYKMQEDAWWKTMFMRSLMRLDRNDETLEQLLEGCGDTNGYMWQWTNENLTMLGQALIGNTNLKVLGLTVSAAAEGQDELPNQEQQYTNTLAGGIHVLYRGIAQSQLISLVLVGMYGSFQRNLLEKANFILPLGQLTLTNLTEMPMFLSVPTTIPRQHPWSHVTNLILTDGQWEEPDMLNLCFCLAKHPWLTFLRLAKNQITDAGISLFCQCWNHDSPLRELDLSGNRIGASGAQQLIQASAHHPALNILMLVGNSNIGHAGLQLVGEQLAQSTVKHLDVTGCVPEGNIAPEAQEAACRALANGVRGNTTLVSLFMGANKVGDLGAQVLMQAVAVHPTLQTFSLAHDKSIGLKGVKSIGEELLRARIKVLGLEGICTLPWPNNKKRSKLDREAREALLQAVRTNDNIARLRADGIFNAFYGPESDFEFFLGRNAVFRPLIASRAMFPAVWPMVLSHALPSFIYYALVEQPGLVVCKAEEETN